MKRLGLVLASLGLGILCASCKKEGNESIAAPGYAVVYLCNLSNLDDGKDSQEKKVTFTWYEPTATASPVQRVLVSDERYERSPSAVIVVLDKARRRVEQARNRDGIPLELSMTSRYISTDDALAFQFVRVANFVLDTAASALAKSPEESSQNKDAKNSPDSRANSGKTGSSGTTGTRIPSSKVAAFRFEEKSFLASDEDNVKGGYGYGSLASRISRTDVSGDAGVTCRHETTHSPR